MDEVEQFITKRFSDDCNWLTGNCYYFAIILKNRFSYLQIVYFPVPGHFAVIDNKSNYFYDWSGKYQSKEWFYYWDDLEKVEPNLYHRILTDCVM